MTSLYDYTIGHNLPHWRFYQSLEDDLEKCFKYVSPNIDQFDVYSDEFSKIILVASSEFENVLKEIKAYKDYTCNDNILEYYNLMASSHPNFGTMKFIMPRYSIEIQPLADWSATQSPDWWGQGYNKIKHRRIDNPKAASLIRALNSVASLQVVLLHLYKMKFDLVLLPIAISPKLIEPASAESISFFDTGFIGWEWRLPDELTD
ncbi:hypothetical protein E5F05_16810 [Deinococcus metallilatus]|uniref:Uncharacterized protein n=1 Tax=Deinococcus metallilatus TaxID=1211322 RepID=A0AAJ5F5C9_9DEIO|nr:hypothetical protein [Deinococcus metallilatus]MBB5294828.1 hypothetical protein [Deinococcus metallilatus]QBY09455.1 hypothetical protein E5F05_16810 [Deinococcus metallilatus]RXJ09460.1 hypothetical protein ERJ73_15650 [Deinococcus metallilatus]TLK28983.1 hypothetical protein FCS05_07415 [Deinococcus metallilatus]GMA16755.1 hypothetical protein GCM10025871_30860 [Deinococcus metallilatus]